MLDTKARIPLATAAALMAMASLAVPAQAGSMAKDRMVACYGVNACKGQSDCKTAENACKGQNGCKGQGFKDLTAADCKAQGGSTEKPK